MTRISATEAFCGGIAARMAPFRERIPGCQGQPHTTIEGGGHFLQEDRGPELARVIVDWMRGLGAL